MTAIPTCKRCGRGMRQRGRYADWTCECCDENKRKCPHVKGLKKLLRKVSSRA